MQRVIAALVFGLGVMGALTTAQAESEDYTKAQALVQGLISSHKDRSAAIEATREQFAVRTALCVYCHGVDGVSSNPDVPSLAGQNAAYIGEQLLNFTNGNRKLKVMHDLAEGMEESEVALIALHFSQMLPGEAQVDPVLVESGAPLYAEHCASCHGVEGDGGELAYARLGGQHPDYLFNTLRRFNDGESERKSTTMHTVGKKLTLLQMKALSHFAASLP